MSKIDIPIYIFAGTNDTIADVKDNTDFKSILDAGECPHSELHILDKFDHGTFLWSKNMSYFDEVLKILTSDWGDGESLSKTALIKNGIRVLSEE